MGTAIAQVAPWPPCAPLAPSLEHVTMEVFIRMLIIAALVAIVASLGSALFHLTRGKGGDSAKMSRALTIRIGLSLALFVLLMIAWWAGLIAPHEVAPVTSP
jgi:hypothetical protein